jgi:prevent-host-death family protein
VSLGVGRGSPLKQVIKGHRRLHYPSIFDKSFDKSLFTLGLLGRLESVGTVGQEAGVAYTAAISSLTNYNKVLSKVDEGNEVILTKNGTSKYAVVSIDEWNYTQAMLRFLTDMREVDDEMRGGGKSYTEQELLASLGIA